MREFVVEVPAYVRVSVDAFDAGSAAVVAEKIVSGLEFGETLERVGGVWQLVQPEILPLAGEDGQPDVYLCSGGKLAYVNDNGFLEGTGEDCDAGTR